MPIILHLNTKGLSARKICVVSQLATRHKTLMILLQESHYTNADQLVIPHFTLAGLLSSKKLGLAAFVSEKLRNDQQLSGCVWTLMVARLSASTNLQPRDWYQQPFQCSHTLVSMLVLAHGLELWFYQSRWRVLGCWAVKSNLTLLYNSKEATCLSLVVARLELIQT